MLTDWLAFSPASDVGMTGPFTEIVNSARAYAYAESANLGWLQECDHCPTAHPASHSYLTPSTGSVAPWWNGDPDRAKFLGVVGLGVEGADDSTRQAKVSNTLSTPGGVIGPPYFGPRTMTVRALAIATDDCGLQAGINWLQFSGVDAVNPCGPPSLNYYECSAESSMPSYLRQFRGARITAGPEFLQINRAMPSGGAFATFELTIVTADPTEYTPTGFLMSLQWAGGEVITDAAAA